MNIKTLIAGAMITLSIFTFSCSKKKEQIVIKGSSTVLPIAMALAEVFADKHGIAISVTGTGSANGITALIDGTCDIANSSRAMTPEELDQAISRGIDILETPIAYDMVVPIVHPSNNVNNLYLGQIQEIYRGAITNWGQVGGEHSNIVVTSRDSSSGTFSIWYKIVIKKEEITRKAMLQATNGTMVYAVSSNPNAIGYISYGYLDKSVKAVSINNVKPTIQNCINGTYPVSRKLYMYTDKKRLKKETQDFIDFTVSEEGKTLLQKAGFIPR
ncbi:MAG TPA: PstS family phosphate ABC transporter substrate-binding protein [Spirochaetota bacterium]|nr:PstS family phosphate ABC transporter substrate-binding protein [Spirochaetota bacterium]HPI89258.1 PstS family phosphate ABC transporter substrate-binding protein [Spirochaetota bacterium]HPR48582.1 PstS family phosphate ABC transporter substrate-binding protein [Spirochaetota bacterium]